MSLFQEATQTLSAAVDEVYGEAFLFLPMTRASDVNARPVPDPARAQVSFTAAYIDAYARAHSGPVRTPGVEAEAPGHASDRPQISFAAAALPYPVRSGDRVQRMANAAVFQIADPRRAGRTRIACDLTRI